MPLASDRLFSSAVTTLLAGLSTMTGFVEERRDAIPYIPTSTAIMERMLDLAEVGGHDIVMDMGSGDGRIVIAAAQRGAYGRGVEIEPSLVERAKQNARNAGVAERTEFFVQDMFETPMNEVTVLTLYVLTSSNIQLRPRILKEMQPGTRVVSHQFGMGDWIADRQENHGNIPIYLWVIPAPAGGNWRFESGDDSFTLEITQRYQRITGAAHFRGMPHALLNLNLSGSEIDFEIDFGQGKLMPFHGIVRENTIEPRAATGENKDRWRASRIGPVPVIAR